MSFPRGPPETAVHPQNEDSQPQASATLGRMVLAFPEWGTLKSGAASCRVSGYPLCRSQGSSVSGHQAGKPHPLPTASHRAWAGDPLLPGTHRSGRGAQAGAGQRCLTHSGWVGWNFRIALALIGELRWAKTSIPWQCWGLDSTVTWPRPGEAMPPGVNPGSS